MTIGNALLLQRLLTSTLFQCIRLIFIAIQWIYWELNGTAAKVRQSRDLANYERCCQVLDVRSYHRFCILGLSSDRHFILTHNRFESPQYVIDNDHISLMCFNDKNAVFCEALEKGMHLWRTEFNSFIRFAQYSHARRLIIVPLSAFHRMAETIGDTEAEIMECTDRCASASEPNSPTLVAQMFAKQGDTPEIRRLARDVIRWECRPYPSIRPPPLAYVFKIVPTATRAVELFRDVCTKSKCLFLYRDSLKVARSVYRLGMALPSLRLAYILGKLSAHFTEKLVDGMGFSGKDFHIRCVDDFAIGIMEFIVTAKAYVEMRRRGAEVKALRYEELVGRPLEMCRAIMDYCELPLSLAESAVKGLELDSQRNSEVSKAVIGSVREPELTVESKEWMNKLLAKHGLPLVGEETILEGTLLLND